MNVTAETPMLDVTSKEVGGNITTRELVELPTINGNFVGFVGLLPGIVPTISTESFGSDSIAVNGQDPRNNNYMLDGGNNNDDVIGQRAGTQARTPIEAIQEFQVITNQFDAEFGRTTGAVVNAVTKSRDQHLARQRVRELSGRRPDGQGLLREEERNRPSRTPSISAFGGTRRRADHQGQGAFLLQPRALHHRRRGDDQHPDAAELQHHHDREDRVWNTVVRGDHQINANNTWGVRWLREASPQYNQIIDNVTLDASREEFDIDQTVVGSVSSVLSQHQGELDAAGVDA